MNKLINEWMNPSKCILLAHWSYCSDSDHICHVHSFILYPLCPGVQGHGGVLEPIPAVIGWRRGTLWISWFIGGHVACWQNTYVKDLAASTGEEERLINTKIDSVNIIMSKITSIVNCVQSWKTLNLFWFLNLLLWSLIMWIYSVH